MTTMRMLLIDPDAREVRPVDVDPHDYQAQEKLLGAGMFDHATVHIGGSRYFVRLDDIGALECKTAFRMRRLYGGPLYGKALVFGLVGPEGDAGPCDLEPDELARFIDWDAAA